ncbi:MAG: TaqI-like C-terminal specificity domain-containing protein [Candidatus Cloacimonas sp.]
MNIITNCYDRTEWLKKLKALLYEDYMPEETPGSLGFESKLLNNNITYLGESKKLKLEVFEVTQIKGDDPRVSITRELFKLVRNRTTRNALFFIVPERKDNFRLSLVTRDLTRAENKIDDILSNPKRYSYLLGPGVKKHTIEKYLFKPGRIKDIENLKSRFSIEVVNKDFYNGLSELFSKLVGGKRGKTEFQGLLKLPSVDHDQTKREFAIRLIGRVVFCWFLKKKESANGDPLIPESILSSDSVANNSDYYHKVLEPLFFEVMNKKHEVREPDIKANQDFENIPFLNGGLFDYNAHSDFYKPYGEDSDQRYSFNLIIPDEWFIELFKLFELYNFTIDENTPVDIDISVDPEMLGRIFENLLAEINPETEDTARKSSGSFYTPREIVEFMVDESLLEHILSKFDDRDKYEPKLRKLLDYSEDDGYDFTPAEKRIINDCLDDMKILDPACGSGAFPMGILQKMYLIRQKLDPDLKSWIDKQLRGIKNPVLRKDAEKKYEYENSSYLYKVFAILKSIYGVDIQPLAVEISKLRFFLTLIVDQKIDDSKPNRGVSSLPNLAFKFIAANSLIRLKESKNGYEVRDTVAQDWTYLNSESHFDALNTLREEYFATDSIEEKVMISEEFRKRQKLLANEIIDNQLTDTSIIKITNWNPFSDEPTDWFDPKWMFGVDGGFDIVIGNPPYGADISDEIKKNVTNYFNYADIKKNSASLFIEQASLLANKNHGIISLIVPKSLSYSSGWEPTRNLLLVNKQITSAIDAGKSFENVLLEQVIVTFKNRIENIEYSFRVGYKSGNSMNITGVVGSNEALSLNTLPMHIDDISSSIYHKSNKYTVPLSSISSTCRGLPVQKKLSDKGIPLIAGRDIQRYCITPSNKTYDININDLRSERMNTFHSVKIISQNIVAHVTRPTDRIIITSAIDYQQRLNLDTVMNTVLTDKNFQYEYILGILNSSFASWFYYLFVFNKAIRTMHLDGYYLGKLPIPKVDLDKQSRIANLVNQIHTNKSNNQDTSQLESQIDQIVYELYHLTDGEIAYIEEATKR